MDNKFMLNGKEYNGNDNSGEVFGLFGNGYTAANEMTDGGHGRFMIKIRTMQVIGTMIAIIVFVGCIAATIYGWSLNPHSIKINLTAILFAGFLLFIGALIIMKSIPEMIKKMGSCTKEVRGVVSGFKIGTGSKGGRNYTPEFEYMYNGTTYKLQSKSGSYKKPTVGETVSIFVDPAHPQNAYEPKAACATVRTSLFMGNILMILGASVGFFMHI